MSYPQSNADQEYALFLKKEHDRKRDDERAMAQLSSQLKESTKRLEEIAKADQEQAQQDRSDKLRKGTLAYSEPLAIEICERISSGELLINICLDEHMPTVRRCNQWLGESIEFKGLYGASISDRLNIFEEEIIRIADDASRDFKEVVRNGRAQRVPDGEAIARAKLRVEMRLKHLRAYRPDRWAEQSTLITKSADGFDPTSMTAEELEKTISDIERKSGVVRPKAA
jgi:hypothetical protein